MLTFGSLFAGIGGFDLGLEWAGMKCEWQVEYDDYCNKILKKHWPDVPRYGDIKEIDPDLLPPVDLICGGFPCQPVSIIGKGLAQDDERWLWPEFCRIVRGVRPKYVLVENVSGLLGRGIGDVLGDLAAIGYDTEWQCVPASAVGAPHLRYRVWIFAWDRSRRRQGDVADADSGPATERGERPPTASASDGRRDGRERSDRDSGQVAIRGAGEDSGDVADADSASAWARSGEGKAPGGVAQPDWGGRSGDGGSSSGDGDEGLVAHAIEPGLEGHAGHGDGAAGRQVPARSTCSGGIRGGASQSGVDPDSGGERFDGRTSGHGSEGALEVASRDHAPGLDGDRGEEARRLARRAVRAARDSGRGGIFGDADSSLRLLRFLLRVLKRGWWATEPSVGRVVNGLPNRVDRIKALGNAVVPQNAYFLGTLVSAFDEMTR